MIAWTRRRLGFVNGLLARRPLHRNTMADARPTPRASRRRGTAAGGPPGVRYATPPTDTPADPACPRVLVLSAGVGAGHVRAGDAVTAAVRELCPCAVVRHIDVLELSNRAFKFFNADVYFGVIARSPHLAGYLYDKMDEPGKAADGAGDQFRTLINRLNLRALERVLRDEPWDVAINTHFLSAGVIAHLRAKGKLDLPQATVTTDYDVHRLWITPETDLYFAATDESRANILARGLAPEQVYTTGIPVAPEFLAPPTRAQARQQLGLDPDRPVILQMAGGFGLGPIEQVHRGLLDVERPIQLITCAGRNEKALAALRAVDAPHRHHRRVLGFTSDMHVLMSAADLIVTKPGGLTVAESLACGAVMAMVDPIPGQETRNADFVLESGAGIKVNNLTALSQKVGHLLADEHRLATMRRCALAAARPRAAYDVARLSLGLATFSRLARSRLGASGG